LINRTGKIAKKEKKDGLEMRKVEQPKRRKRRQFESAPAQPSYILVNPMDNAESFVD
jgi:hypothetical protein